MPTECFGGSSYEDIRSLLAIYIKLDKKENLGKYNNHGV